MIHTFFLLLVFPFTFVKVGFSKAQTFAYPASYSFKIGTIENQTVCSTLSHIFCFCFLIRKKNKTWKDQKYFVFKCGFGTSLMYHHNTARRESIGS